MRGDLLPEQLGLWLVPEATGLSSEQRKPIFLAFRGLWESGLALCQLSPTLAGLCLIRTSASLLSPLTSCSGLSNSPSASVMIPVVLPLENSSFPDLNMLEVFMNGKESLGSLPPYFLLLGKETLFGPSLAVLSLPCELLTLASCPPGPCLSGLLAILLI